MDSIGNWRHLCVDTQRMFLESTPWTLPWMTNILPQLEALSQYHAARTIFTRFIPPKHRDDAVGAWNDYYRKWWMMTGEHLEGEWLDLAPSLRSFVPPARIFDKTTYSPWIDGRLLSHLHSQSVDTIVVTGGETDVCVLATVLGAIDLGLHVILLSDAVCSGADETHDAAVGLLENRFSVQLDLKSTEEFLSLTT